MNPEQIDELKMESIIITISCIKSGYHGKSQYVPFSYKGDRKYSVEFQGTLCSIVYRSLPLHFITV